MSDAVTIATPQRQTIPFADRPIVNEQGYPTAEFNQWAIRLQGGSNTTISNVSTVTEGVNIAHKKVGTLAAEVGSLAAEVDLLAGEIGAVESPFPPYPPSGVVSLDEWNAGTVVAVDPTQLEIAAGGTLAFITGPTILAQAGSHPVIINTTTAVPLAAPSDISFEIIGAPGTRAAAMFDSFGLSGRWLGRRANGTPSAPTAMTLGQSFLVFSHSGYGATAYSIENNFLAAQAAGTWTDTSQPTQVNLNTIPSGGTLAVIRLQMTSSGRALMGPVLPTDDGIDALQVNGPALATFYAQGVGNNLVLTGSTQAGALPLTHGLNVFGTVPASSGAELPSIGTLVAVGTSVICVNPTVTKGQVYGAGSQTVDGATATTGVPLSGGNRCLYFANTASTWISAQLGPISS